ncbi:SlyX family protein [Granulosicoccus antarcticus]|nr:SlyX family protein [Granulosicoccus antarcticus]
MSESTYPTDPAVDARIETLELKLMDVENTVQELHEVILRQYRDIERLQLQQNELMNRMHGSTDSADTPSTTDELPPHY